jgi:hypothetical protein
MRSRLPLVRDALGCVPVNNKTVVVTAFCMSVTFPGEAGLFWGGSCDVSSSLPVCDISSYPFLPMRAHPCHLPFPLSLFLPEPTLRPACLEGFVLNLRPPNEQVVSAFGLLLRPGFGWYLEILYSELCNIICIKVFICYLVFCFSYIL